ncbi:bifunctional DNA primase/polymerase [Candidatus Frankia nodulisporulans]|uniref:bifunctional DNA primase/polymerase n=1 Tax=Candidatus Frankia nodulisporulans TaxID=2060052 RepID=UPI0013D651BF|nr:bifunctional DNA primase/polymerase [Candidatus Frankia nodulisporulans]
MPVTASGALAAALNAAFRGWYVLPLRPGRKIPLAHDVDHCPRTGPCAEVHRTWEQRATRDLAQVEAHWHAHRHHGVGIATGPSGLVVVDLDTPKPTDPPLPEEWQAEDVRNGADVLAALAHRAEIELPRTYTVRTGRGGWHLYYAAPDGIRLGNTSRTLGPWIDTRAWGGQVVAAGTTVAGRPYKTVRDLPVAPLPTALFQRLHTPPRPAPRPVLLNLPAGRRAAYLGAAISRQLTYITDATTGERNTALYRSAVALGQLAAGGALTETDVNDMLKQAAAIHIGTDGFTWTAAEATIRSGLRAGAARPRQIPA